MRTAPIVSFLGTKGGLGKTMASVHVATELHERGHRLMLLDIDPRAKGSARSWGTNADSKLSGLRIVHEPIRYQSVADFKRIRLDLQRMATGQSVLFVDAPGHHGAEFDLMMAVSDLVVLPVGPAREEIEVLEDILISNVPPARRLNPSLSIAILAVRTAEKRTLTKSLNDELAACPWPVFTTSLPLTQDFPNARARLMSVTSHVSGKDAALAVRSLASEFEAALQMETNQNVA
jgi:cellulose biosynthesis protein BcsQ